MLLIINTSDVFLAPVGIQKRLPELPWIPHDSTVQIRGLILSDFSSFGIFSDTLYSIFSFLNPEHRGQIPQIVTQRSSFLPPSLQAGQCMWELKSKQL